MKNKILAKDCGIDLITHSQNVSKAAIEIFNNVLSYKDDELLEIVKIGSLLHDIGKANEEFQLKLRKKNYKTTNKFRHNEIGWAFLELYFKHNSEIKNMIGKCVYWHHGISNKLNSYDSEEVLSSISQQSIENMIFILESLLGKEVISKTTNSRKSPLFFEDEGSEDTINEKFSLVRKIIISADVIISAIEGDIKDFEFERDKELFYNEYNKHLYKENEYNFDNFPYNDRKRFEEQNKIVDLCGKTTIVKAPAGFGKTLIGLLFAAKHKEKTIWVTPRNVVAESIYDSIINELKSFKITNVKVELFLSNEVVKRNYQSDKEFESDIIITNIDNFESPSFKDKSATRLFTILNANVVFDEYHEFVSTCAYYSVFINLMRIRNKYTKSKTILLSATPVYINEMWESHADETKTIFLPNKNEHYKPSHDKKYKIRVVDKFKHDLTGCELIVLNSIKESQRVKSLENVKHLFHSSYIKEDKNEKIKLLCKEYDKHSDLNVNKDGVVSSLIMQASLDLSFDKLYESIMSPEATLQRIGRCNRFGTYDDSVITIFKLYDENNSEGKVVDIFYDLKLAENWYQEILKYNNKYLSLSEIYEIYNKHILKFEEKRKKFFKDRYKVSKNKLKNIYPIRFDSTKKDKILTSNSNKLRSVGSEIFYIVQWYDQSKWSDVFNTQIYNDFDKDFNEDLNILNRMGKVMKFLSDDERFDFSKMINKFKRNRLTIDEIRRNARKSNTPYIVFDRVYHPEFGVIDKDLLSELNINKTN